MKATITADLISATASAVSRAVYASTPTIIVSRVTFSDGRILVLADEPSKKTWERDKLGEKQSPQKVEKRRKQAVRFEDTNLIPDGGLHNIQKLYAMATPEERDYWGNFYYNGQEDMRAMVEKYKADYAANYGGKELETWIVAGLVALLSPNMNWDKNLDAARRILQGNKEKNQAYPPMVKLAVAFATNPDPDMVRGEKTGPFFDSFVDPHGQDDTVVVDGHMANLWIGQIVRLQQKAVPATLKTKVQEDVRRAAAEAGITAQAMQAIVWYCWRDKILNAPLQPGEDHPPPPAGQPTLLEAAVNRITSLPRSQ